MLAFFLMIFHNSEINGEKMSKTLKLGCKKIMKKNQSLFIVKCLTPIILPTTKI